MQNIRIFVPQQRYHYLNQNGTQICVIIAINMNDSFNNEYQYGHSKLITYMFKNKINKSVQRYSNLNNDDLNNIE